MRSVIREFIEITNLLLPKNLGDIHTISNSYKMNINRVNVIGSMNIVANDSNILCVRSGSSPIENVEEVMTAFRKELGMPTFSRFVVGVGCCYPMILVNIGTVVISKNTGKEYIYLNNGSDDQNWDIVNCLKNVVGEPTDKRWRFSVAYYWDNQYFL